MGFPYYLLTTYYALLTTYYRYIRDFITNEDDFRLKLHKFAKKNAEASNLIH